MYTTILLWFCAFLVVGIGFSFCLFNQDVKNKKSTKFITSERLLMFLIEIFIAVIGFGITLAITNANEHQVAKEKAIVMLQQTVEYTDRQLEMDRKYLVSHNKENISDVKLQVSDVISMEFYYNILSNETILQNANMNTYGELMRYMTWVENNDERAKQADEGKVYSYLYQRYTNLQKARDLMQICCDEMSGKITAEEALVLCNNVKYGETDQKADTSPAS